MVHALDLKCMTPAQAETAGDTVFHPHAGGTGIHIRRRPQGGMNPMNDEFNWTPDELQAIVDEHALVLFMKGEPGAPQCGFSNRAAQALQAFGEPFASVNILTDRRAIPAVCEWSDFPTMPQIFVHGELIGGSDIVLEMLQDGSLREMFDEGRQG